MFLDILLITLAVIGSLAAIAIACLILWAVIGAIIDWGNQPPEGWYERKVKTSMGEGTFFGPPYHSHIQHTDEDGTISTTFHLPPDKAWQHSDEIADKIKKIKETKQ